MPVWMEEVPLEADWSVEELASCFTPKIDK